MIEFFPKAAERYRRQVPEIHVGLSRDEAGNGGAIASVGTLIAEIVVQATPAPDLLGFDVEGILSILLSEAPDLLYPAIKYCSPPNTSPFPLLM